MRIALIIIVEIQKIFLKKRGYNKFLNLVIFVTVTLLISCNDNPIINGGGPCPSIVSSSAYTDPVWHPSGEFIGFNHIPLINMTFPYEGCPHLGHNEFDYNLAGFYLIQADGTNMRRIFPYTLQSPVWSPDGEWIAFTAPGGSDDNHIFKMRFIENAFDTTSLIQLTEEGLNFLPTWSSDGEWIAFDSNVNSPSGMNFIWKMRADGSQKIRIDYEPTKGEIRHPNWSPNNKIVHIRYIGIGTPEVFTMNSSGDNLTRLTFDENFDTYPKYSPDGNTIAFASDRIPASYIYLMDSDGTNLRQLINDFTDRSFYWSPSGNKIVYTKFRSDEWSYENGVLWIVDINTGGKKQLTFNP